MKRTHASTLVLVSLWALIAGVFLASSYALAQQAAYPQHVDQYVDDYADIINAGDTAEIRQTFEDLRKRTGVHAVVVTIRAMSDYNTSESSVEGFARGLFNYWGIGERGKNNGVLLFVAKQDRKVRIETGSGFGSTYNAQMQQIISSTIVPSFKAGDFSSGIRRASSQIAQVMSGGGAPVQTAQPYNAPAPSSGGSSWLTWLLIIGGIIVVVSLIRSGKVGWGWIAMAGVGALIGWLISSMWGGGGRGDGDGGSGFGGGDSSGGGASGDW